jgi:hypothetical protein
MPKPFHSHLPTGENDVVRLFSTMSPTGAKNRYRETVLQDSAHEAAARWPLLAEVETMLAAADRGNRQALA